MRKRTIDQCRLRRLKPSVCHAHELRSRLGLPLLRTSSSRLAIGFGKAQDRLAPRELCAKGTHTQGIDHAMLGALDDIGRNVLDFQSVNKLTQGLARCWNGCRPRG